MTGRARLYVALLALGTSTSCSPSAERPWHQEAGYRWRALEVRQGDAGFTRMREARTGIRFRNEVSESALLANRVLGQGGGVALGDVDGDGLVDVFLARTEGCSALYRNLGNWRFEDITERAGVGACDRNSTGAAFVDVDGVNGLDLVLVSTRGPNVVFLNDGTGRFTERRDLGLDTTGRGATSIALADVDGDGDLDLFVANYNPYNVDDSLPPTQRAFNEMVRQTGPNRYEIVPDLRAHYRLVMRPDMGGLRVTQRGAPDDYYVNEGGRFRRIPFDSGYFLAHDGRPIEEQESFTLAARFADLNGDGAPDLWVANDFEDPDEVWLNDGKGRFRRAHWTAVRQFSHSTMGVDVGDVNRDGHLDVFAVDMLSNDPVQLKTQIPAHTALPKIPGDVATQLQLQRNSLYLNRGDGTFAEISAAAGVHASGWSWGTMLVDVDLDGWEDVLITTGHPWDLMDADTHERLQNRLTDLLWRRLRWQFPPLELKNVAFRNRGDLTFEDVSEAWNFGIEADLSHGMAAADLDGDGDMDVVINRLDAPALVLRNDAGAPRVLVRLVGEGLNTRAVGAKVRLLGGAVPEQMREVFAGGLYLSHSDYAVSFAMGRSDSATLVVDWRDGRRTTIHGVRPNREYEVSMSAAGPRLPQTAPPPVPLFEDATRELRGHRHVDQPFNDWGRQFLLTEALSQLGPGAAWIDADGDGDDDLVIGAGRGGRIALLRNDAGRLRAPEYGPVTDRDLAGIVGLPQTGGTRLLVGATSWEIPHGGTPQPIVLSMPAAGVAARPDVLFAASGTSAGPLALGDYDGDGDLDLFVGGRVVPGAYPRAGRSYLLRNDGGRFVEDTAASRALSGIGMVSAAVFADIDSDGDADLLIARDWGSLVLLRNDAGRFTEATAALGLDRWTGRWIGVATGDLDGDGRLDIVATNWGRNTFFQADSTRPLVLLHGPFGAGGREEAIVARRDSVDGPLMPLNPFPSVRQAIPDIGDRLRTFAEYAGASVEQVLGPALPRAPPQRLQAATLDHMVFLNRGNRFEAVPLPIEAQLAPAHYAGIADFDGDGVEDVFLTQNFYPTAVGSPRYDAGLGLLLRGTGDGRGGLEAVSASESGIRVYGDQRGAAYADFDRDGRLDLVVTQNGAESRLFRNRGARPGLRIRIVGPAGNPRGVGTQLRISYGDRRGPLREVQAGSGYWSQNALTQVLGLDGEPKAVEVLWPGGRKSVVAVPRGARELTIRPE